MGFINKNVNLVLLFLVFFVVAGMIGVSTYYQNTYLNLSKDYVTRITQLNKVSYDLALHKSKLNETLSQYRIKDEREKDLSTKYTDLRGLHEHTVDVLNFTNRTLLSTRSELSATRLELNSKSLELESTKVLLSATRSNLESEQARVRSLEDEKEVMETRLESMQDEINDREDEIEDLEDQLAACPAGP
ncbi:MAG: hypothetical protein ABH879_07075 [archaeon]